MLFSYTWLVKMLAPFVVLVASAPAAAPAQPAPVPSQSQPASPTAPQVGGASPDAAQPDAVQPDAAAVPNAAQPNVALADRRHRPSRGQNGGTPATPIPPTIQPSTPAPPQGSPPTGTVPSPPAAPTGPLRNTPAQPGAIVYGSTSGVSAYAKPGAMVVAGRGNYADPAFKAVAAAGGHVLVYLDTIIDSATGRYHQMLLQASTCGPAVPRWPGNPRANDTGNLNDFRVGGVLQSKLECVLEAIATENPWITGFFADDVGSRSWFPLLNWTSWSKADQQAYRDGAIALTKTFRKVADKHGMIFMVNGTWTAGDLSGDGGGYPDMNQHGNALADGGFIEHHDGEVGFFGKYACSPQWAAQSAMTKGTPFNFSVSMSDSDRNAYANSGCIAYAATQRDYGTTPPPWAAFHANGLPA